MLVTQVPVQGGQKIYCAGKKSTSIKRIRRTKPQSSSILINSIIFKCSWGVSLFGQALWVEQQGHHVGLQLRSNMPRALAHFTLSFRCIAVNYNCTYLGWSQQLQSMFELFRVITTLLPKYLYPGSLKRKSGPRSFSRILTNPYSKESRMRIKPQRGIWSTNSPTGAEKVVLQHRLVTL